MNNPELKNRDGKHLAQVLYPIRLREFPNGVLYAATYRGSVVLEGLMRNAHVKANGDEVVDALNRVHALGWALSRGDVRIVIALRDLIVETFEISENAAELGATLICDDLKISTACNIRENVDEFLKVAQEYKNDPVKFNGFIKTGFLMEK